MSRWRVIFLLTGGTAIAMSLIVAVIFVAIDAGNRSSVPLHRTDNCDWIQAAADRGETRLVPELHGGHLALIAPYSISPRLARKHPWIDSDTYRQLDSLDDAPEDVLVVRFDGRLLVEYCHLDSRFEVSDAIVEIREGDELRLEYRDVSRPVLLSQSPR